MNKNEVVLIGYSGHGFVVCDIFLSMNWKVKAYCDNEEKEYNPFSLPYWGKETEEETSKQLRSENWFVGIGNNLIRKKIIYDLEKKLQSLPVTAIHHNSSISSTANISHGVMISSGVIINACANIGKGVICNTQAVIEHECTIGDFSHIGPGAVLCGDVTIGGNSFVGARSVIKQGIKIGENVTIGAGTVVIADVPSHSKIVGNPQRHIIQ